MKIALYDGVIGSGYSHHALPFWRNPQQPKLLFNSEVMGDFRNCNNSSILLKESCHWSMLMALHSMELPGIMAHVSLSVDIDVKQFGGNKRVWVNITTLPSEQKEGIPLVIKEGKLNVLPIWAKDNGMVKDGPNVYSPLLTWVEFFSSKINEERLALGKEIEELHVKLKQKEDLSMLYPVLL